MSSLYGEDGEKCGVDWMELEQDVIGLVKDSLLGMATCPVQFRFAEDECSQQSDRRAGEVH